MSKRRGALSTVLVLAVSIACGEAGPGSEVEIDYAEIYLVTSEAEGPLSIMLTGETGTVEAFAWFQGVGVDPGIVNYTSTDETVLELRRTGDRTADVIAIGEGSASIVLSAGPVQDSREVLVAAVSDPIFDMRLRLETSGTATIHYEPGVLPPLLRGVELPFGESVGLFVSFLRSSGGGPITRIPFDVSSSDPDAIQVELHCRNADLEVDPDCSEYSPWAIVRRIGDGAGTITVRVQTLQATFYVQAVP